MTGDQTDLDPIAVLRAIAAHDVQFVVIGGIAGALHGSTTVTADLDVLYERDPANVKRLATVLGTLGATRRDLPKSVKAPIDARALLGGTNFLLRTRFGDVDCVGETPSGRFTYREIAVTAERYEVEPGLIVAVASIDQLIRMKRAAGRPKDLAEVEILSALKEERVRRG